MILARSRAVILSILLLFAANLNRQGSFEMIYNLKRGVLLLPLMASALLSACVSQT